jgi:hypothetical protein
MRSVISWVLLCGVLAINVACSDDTPTTPTPTTPTTVTDTFSGTVTTNGAATHNFIAVAAGTVTATLTSLSPNPDLVIGFGIGTWNGTVCNVVLARDRAVQTTVIFGNVNAAGELCVRIYDVGTVTEPTDYSISVVHP